METTTQQLADILYREWDGCYVWPGALDAAYAVAGLAGVEFIQRHADDPQTLDKTLSRKAALRRAERIG